MATKAEILQCLTMLSAGFPDWQKGLSEDKVQETFSVYVQLLADLPAETLKVATLQHLATALYFPKVVELRVAVEQILAPVFPSAVEAWDALTTGKETSEVAHTIFRQLGLSRGDLRYMEYKDISVTRAHFLKEYSERIQRLRDERKLLPQVQVFRQQLKQQSIGQIESLVSCLSCAERNPHMRYAHWLTFSNEDALKQHFFSTLGPDAGLEKFNRERSWFTTKKSSETRRLA